MPMCLGCTNGKILVKGKWVDHPACNGTGNVPEQKMIKRGPKPKK